MSQRGSLRYSEHMFMLAVAAPLASHGSIRARLGLHFDELRAAGGMREVSVHESQETLLFFDGESPFANLTQASDGFTLQGGFTGERGVGEYARISLLSRHGAPELVAETDRYASWPLFYAQSNAGVAVGNDPHALAIALGLFRLNEESVFQLVTMMFNQSRCTTIDGVNRLWSGERVVIGVDQSRLQEPPQVAQIIDGHHFAERVTDQPGSVDEYLEKTFSLLVESTAEYRLGESDVVSTLSGGLDSRFAVGAMRTAGVKEMQCLTFNFVADDEGTVAGQVADRLGYDHVISELPEAGKAAVRSGWLLTGGQKPVHSAADGYLISQEALKGKESVRLVTATLGDPLDGSLVPPFQDFFGLENLRLCARYWLRSMTNNVSARQALGNGAVQRRALRRLRRSLFADFLTTRGPSAAQKINFWDFTRRSPVFAHVTTSKLSTNVLEMQPELAPEYVECFYGLRPVDLAQRNFYQRMIWTMLPLLRDIPNHNTGKPISPEYASFGWMSWKLKLLLRLPASLHFWVEDQLRRASQKGRTVTVPSESVYYSRLIEPFFCERVTLTPGLSFDLSKISGGPFQKANTAAAALACLWTKEYLEKIINKSPTLSDGSPSGGFPEG